MKVFVIFSLVVAAALAEPSRKLGFPMSNRAHPGRINGGDDSVEGEFPYQLSYQWDFFGIKQHICGASILTETWVATAAHCVALVPEVGDFSVIAGIWKLSEKTNETQEVIMSERLVHPDYDTDSNGGVGPNDIALAKLEKALVFGKLVQPIALPVADSTWTGDAVLSGWGATNPDPTIIPIVPDILQKALIPILSYGECEDAIDDLLQGEENPLSEVSNICTGPLAPGVGACSGDSGGPLAQNGTLVGIVSWGFIPCASGAPSVFTKVDKFIDFITEHVDDLPK